MESSMERMQRLPPGWLRRFLTGLVLIGLCGMSMAQSTDPGRVLVILSDSGGAYSSILSSLQEVLAHEPALAPTLELIENASSLEARPLSPAQKTSDLIVSIGTRATALALQQTTHTPVLGLLVPRASFDILKAGSGSRSDTLSPRFSAIFLDQPLSRQVNLVRALLPGATHIGALLGPSSSTLQGELEAAARQGQFELNLAQMQADDKPIPLLLKVLRNTDMLLALPDPVVFNRNSLRGLLLTTYRQRVPVLGFSEAYVRAGALAGIHSTPQQIGHQAGNWLLELARQDRWQPGEARFPDAFQVNLNPQVARSLGLRLPDEAALHARLLEMEAAP